MPGKPNVTLLHSAIDTVGAANDLQEAVSGLGEVLRDPYSLWSLWVSSFRSPDRIEILATWSARESTFVPGMEISTGFTAFTSEMAQRIFAGQPAVLQVGEGDLGIISHLLQQEGAAAVAAIPLREGETVTAVLSMATSLPEAIDETDEGMLLALGRGLEIVLMPLILAATSGGEA